MPHPLKPRPLFHRVGHKLLHGLLGVVLTVAAFGLICPGTPSYQGKSVDEWLQAVDIPDASDAVRQAFEQLGPDAMPCLVDELGHKDSWAKSLVLHLPFVDRRSPQARHRRAIKACQAVGHPYAIPALPHLAELLPREWDHYDGPKVFVEIGQADAIPYLRQMIGSTNCLLHSFGVRGLLESRPDAATVLDAGADLRQSCPPLFEALFEEDEEGLHFSTIGLLRFIVDR